MGACVLWKRWTSLCSSCLRLWTSSRLRSAFFRESSRAATRRRLSSRADWSSDTLALSSSFSCRRLTQDAEFQSWIRRGGKWPDSSWIESGTKNLRCKQTSLPGYRCSVTTSWISDRGDTQIFSDQGEFLTLDRVEQTNKETRQRFSAVFVNPLATWDAEKGANAN